MVMKSMMRQYFCRRLGAVLSFPSLKPVALIDSNQWFPSSSLSTNYIPQYDRIKMIASFSQISNLKIDGELRKKLLVHYPELASVSNESIEETLTTILSMNPSWKRNELTASILRECPYIFVFPVDFIKERVSFFKETSKLFGWPDYFDPHPVLPLLFALYISQSKYYLQLYFGNPKRQARFIPYLSLDFVFQINDRLEYLSQNLGITRFDILSVTATKDNLHVLTRPFDLVKQIMILLKNIGVSSEDIYKDMTVFNNNVNTISQRIDKLKAINCLSEFRTWMTRAPETTFTNTYRLLCEEIEVFGPNRDRIAYFSKILKVSRREVEECVKKYPIFTTVKARKCEENINILFSLGYQGRDILNCPRSLEVRASTIHKRHQKIMKVWPASEVVLPLLATDERRWKNIYEKEVRKLAYAGILVDSEDVLLGDDK